MVVFVVCVMILELGKVEESEEFVRSRFIYCLMVIVIRDDDVGKMVLVVKVKVEERRLL